MANVVNRGIRNPSSTYLKYFIGDNTDWNNAEVRKVWSGLKNIMSETWEHSTYTPDLPMLSKMKEHYVFTYGTLKEGFRNHRMLEDQEYVGPASTLNNFNMLVIKDTSSPFPIVFNDGRTNTMGAIYGEVYKVDVPTMRALDYLESNGTMYRRAITTCVVAFRDAPPKKVYAWMYKGKRDFWKSRENRLMQVEPFISHKAFDNINGGRYYLFTKALENGARNS